MQTFAVSFIMVHWWKIVHCWASN